MCRSLPFLSLVSLCCLSAGLGCSGAKPGASAEAEKAGEGKTAKPAGPVRQFKPANQLKNPDGVEADKITESVMPKSHWAQWSTWSPGDVWTTETTNEGALLSRSRWEIVDVADRAVMNALDTTINLLGKETTSRSAFKYVFTGPETDAQPADPKYKFEKRPEARKFKVGNREFTSDTRTDTYYEGNLYSRSWTAESMAGVTLYSETADGKTITRLVEYVSKGQ